MQKSTSGRRRCALVTLALAFAVLAPAAASAHPEPGGNHKKKNSEVAEHPLSRPADDHMTGGVVVQVNAPAELAGEFTAVQWGDSGAVANQTADLVYAGTGCTPANYAPIADAIRGNIALVDSRVSATNPADQCPVATFFQKVQSAQQAGAIGFVQIPAEKAEPRGNATVITADIPALEVWRTDAVLAVRDAAIKGTAVNATLADTREPLTAMSNLPCENGMAGPFECDGVDLLSFVPQEEFNGAGVSDLWGWTDPENDDEYVVVGKTNGVAFFRVTDPTAPEYLGELPNPAVLQEIWHDIKMYKNHAFIVSESEPHGMTVFDLTRLRGVTEPQQWNRDAFYPLNVAAHNVAINEDSGFAYIVGGNAGLVVPDQCLSGLHMVNIQNPKNPTFAGCYAVDGGPGTLARVAGSPVGAAYIHDTQCVIYSGPDTRYTGRELCFNASENKIVVADVTDKSNPVTVGMTPYSNVSYAHQGWLTEDQAYFLANDELDETTHKTNTRTVVFDMRDLKNPKVHFEHFHDTKSIDHNNYVHNGRVYQSNYTSGLRVLDVTNVDDAANRRLDPVGFFDTYPYGGGPTFDGTWSNYPYFASGTIAVSGIDEGLFLVKLAEEPAPAVDIACDNCPLEIRAGESGTAQMTVTNTGNVDDSYGVTVDGVPDGWTVTAVPKQVTLAPAEQVGVAVTVDVPRRARAGTYSFTVTATSSGYPHVSDSQGVTVDVVKGAPSDPGGRG